LNETDVTVFRCTLGGKHVAVEFIALNTGWSHPPSKL